MRIGITCYPTYGGSGAVATELGLVLAERGHEVHFVSYAQPFRLPGFREGVYFHEVDVNQYPLFEYPPYSLALAVTMHQVAVERRLDLFHVHYAIPHATSAWIAKEMLRSDGHDVKIVTTLHGTDITLVGQDPSFWTITRFSLERSDGLTAVSRYLKRETVEAFQPASSEIQVIPNFVDTERYRRDRYECHRQSLAPGGEKILMHISNFRPVKRVCDVVRIYAEVRKQTASRLVMIGDGPEREDAHRLATELGLADDVLFLGKLESVAELLACADLFLLPSEEESFGLVALEAQACEVPVVGSAGSGLSEVVEHGSTGFLHPVGEVESMADSAVTLLEDEEVWKRFGAAGRRRAVEVFAEELVVPAYERYYRRVLGTPEEADPEPITPFLEEGAGGDGERG